MKHTTIATSALALVATLFAGSAFATVTVTPVLENFSDITTTATAASSLGNRTNLLWSAGAGDESVATNGVLKLDTGSAVVTATIDSSVTNEIRKTVSTNKTATFSAKVAFVPATVHPEVTGTDLRFALYAFADAGGTNLYVQSSTGTNNTAIPVDAGDTTVTVNFTAANEFTVTVNGTTKPASGAYGFINNGNLSKVEFQGNGTVDDITLTYQKQFEAATDPVAISGNSNYTLSPAEADFMNDVVANGTSMEIINQKLLNYNATEFADAAKLNLDIAAETKPTYSFGIKGIKRQTIEGVAKVVVTVELTRTATVGTGIRGTLKVKGATDPSSDDNYHEIGSVELSDGDFSEENTTTATFNTSDYKFFKAVIE